jgi:ankyrin repeat protein
MYALLKRNCQVGDDAVGTKVFSACIQETARILRAPRSTLVSGDELHQLGVRLKDRVFKGWIIPILVGACLSVGMSAQSTEPQKKAKSTLQKAEITKFFIGDSIEDSGYETGPLHIIYDDGTEIVKTLPPLKASTEKEMVFPAVGFSDVQLAEDRQTLGWTINVENCCTSYSIPLSVVVFRDKQVLHTFSQGMMVWSWKFVQGGKQVEAVWGPTHGADVGDDCLYDVKSGKLISDTLGDCDESRQVITPDAPKLASTPGDDLIHAAQKGDLPRVLALLAAHAAVNAKDEVLKETALIYASVSGQLDIVRVLLAAHASVNARGIYGNPSALFMASVGGYAAVVSALIAADADVNYRTSSGTSSLMIASSEGHLDVVRILIAAHADVSAKEDNGDTALIHAAGNGHLDVVQDLLDNGGNPGDMTDYGGTPLKAAAEADHVDVVRALLAASANINEMGRDGTTALMSASRAGHLDVVQVLLRAHANVNAKQGFTMPTALMWAAEQGHLEVVQALLEAGADLNAGKGESSTALMKAAQNGHLGVVRALIAAKADVNAADPEGTTALMVAARVGYMQVVKALIEGNADPSIKAHDGNSAEDFARLNGHEQIAELLSNARPTTH